MLRSIVLVSFLCVVFFFKQKTAYEMRISDWSSDVCSSDLYRFAARMAASQRGQRIAELLERIGRRHHRSDGSLSDHLRHVRPRACTVRAARDAADDALRSPALREVGRGQATNGAIDRQHVVEGRGVSVGVASGGRRM